MVVSEGDGDELAVVVLQLQLLEAAGEDDHRLLSRVGKLPDGGFEVLPVAVVERLPLQPQLIQFQKIHLNLIFGFRTLEVPLPG